ncbi:putative zinc finger in N-recognin-domain-containing protein [Cokeromyces recurvatus]|uniref:putative zinc finger in N-recognin-domain-containing protein n=1 Tax=Cokeromyces recurvatus TaxID=90255 RepID=UPI00221E7CCB|nr:putative zinc finger in N-recognin-domain-containing protein [Cokeromyces recurvatus]KAI7902047.1 putative zinc finger in N-recognin-domain-containing protein [Cokeromyces recurvatus]
MTKITDDDNNTVTALDYLQRQEQLEKDAQSILPGKFEKCTFPFGYIRQPIYACKTCSIDEPAGICYSCSIACHAEHDLLELFPKRHFRCDCGLSGKLNDYPCRLTLPAKRIIKKNEENKYNHNFEGRYCRCDTFYNPEKEEGTMYQCIACEDWFHDTCIGKIPETIEDFECYVCRSCTKKYPFLMNGKSSKFSFGLSKSDQCIDTWILSELLIKKDNKETEQETRRDDDVSSMIAEENNYQISNNNETYIISDELENNTTNSSENPNISTGEKRKYQEEKDNIIPNTFKKLKSDYDCKNVDITLLPEHDNIEIFLQENWREALCKCTECAEAYKANHVEYLLAEEKTYEPEEDEDAGKSLFEIGMEQLQCVDRIKAIESLMAYKSLATDIKSFLETFKDTGKIVTKEDIEAFFAAKREEKNQQNE